MGVSKNRGKPPKWMVVFSIIFLGGILPPIFGNHPKKTKKKFQPFGAPSAPCGRPREPEKKSHFLEIWIFSSQSVEPLVLWTSKASETETVSNQSDPKDPFVCPFWKGWDLYIYIFLWPGETGCFRSHQSSFSGGKPGSLGWRLDKLSTVEIESF